MPEESSTQITTLLQHIAQQRRNRSVPFYVAIDGHSGSGKSTLAKRLQTTIGIGHVTIVEGDSFYTGGSGNTWDKRSPAQNANAAVDWRQLAEVLQALKCSGSASWKSFDWHSERWEHDIPPQQTQRCSAQVRNIVIVDGVYSARPELAEYYDLRVLVDLPPAISRQRAKTRDAASFCPVWSRRWGAAETHYFGHCMPTEQFDLVLSPEPCERAVN